VSTIEVFADVWCPFTHVGLARFVQRRAEEGSEVGLHVRAWPLELVNGEPLSYAFVAEEIEAIKASLDTPLFAGLTAQAWPSSTIPALRLTAGAYAHDVSTGEAVALDLRQRLFEAGEDIGDRAVLDDVASTHGITNPAEPRDDAEDPVLQEWHEGQRRNVTGSPHYFTRSGDFFCPALDVERVDGELRVRADPGGFDRFIRAALADA
jgi:predicted DsbA family dithiol-disulfide isomerase